MLGTIVNAAAISVGSIIGGRFKKLMSPKLQDTLLDAMGLAAFGLGINSIVQNMPKSQAPVLFIASLALGGAIGTKMRLDERIKALTQRSNGDTNLGQGLITACLLFCIGTLSILGPVQSALYGDNTFLYTNASLDLVTSMVLASTYGTGIILAALVLTAWQGSLYFISTWLGSVITGPMMVELSIVGGFLIAMSGLSIMKVKDFRTLDYLPALAIAAAWMFFQ